jgi:exopolysaccharide biosynthesis polyprenyl glycosylphosphotransferase
MRERKRPYSYLIFDLIFSEIAWVALYIFRKKVAESEAFGIDIPLVFTPRFFLGIAVIPLIWIFFYAMAGFYGRELRRSRLKELAQSLLFTVIGSVVLFFALMLDDAVADYTFYYRTFGFYFCLQFVGTYVPRLILTTRTNRAIQRGQIGFDTLVIGSGARAAELIDDLEKEQIKNGTRLIGYCTVNGAPKPILPLSIPYLGDAAHIADILREGKAEEVILATEKHEDGEIQRILDTLHEHDVVVKAIPDLPDFLSGSVRMTAIFGTPLIEISPVVMPEWQQIIKRMGDLLVSASALLLLSPLFLLLGLLIRRDGGPVFYRQERIGRRGKPFFILKFRTMIMNAEDAGPALSSKNDTRITPIGRRLRKYRLDELPQFINVFIGEMALVGPRPERHFFIEQIVKKAPHYRLLHRVRPGITSWGMVKYGYAENVEQMIKRLRYDILYMENMSLLLDVKILIYTVLTVIKGRGM